MKYLIILLLTLSLTGCGKKTYELQILYQDGTKETLQCSTPFDYPTLSDGCIYFGSTEDDAIRCGVKSFTYKILQNETKRLY